MDKNYCFSIKPSAVGNYFETKCKRNFAYMTISEDGVENYAYNDMLSSSVSRDRGYEILGNEWEIKVVDRLRASSGCKVIVADENDLTKKFEKQATDELLHKLNDGIFDSELNEKKLYFFQLCINGRKVLLPDFKDDIKWGGCFYPDLVEVIRKDNGYELSVVDIKSSIMMKEGYQIQVAIYAEMLSQLVKDEKLDNICVNTKYAYIYNRGINVQDNNRELDRRSEYKGKVCDDNENNIVINKFSLIEARKELNLFFSKENIKKPFVEALFYHEPENIINDISCIRSEVCEFCNYKEKCYENLCKSHSYKIIPGITVAAQHIVDDSQNVDAEIKIKTWEHVFKVFDNWDDYVEKYQNYEEEDREIDKNSRNFLDDLRYDPFWSDVRGNIEAYKKVMGYIDNDKTISPALRCNKSASTTLFPKTSDYSLIMAAQKDPVSGRNYMYAFSFYKNESDINEVRESIYIAENNSEDELNSNDVKFVNDLYDALVITKKEAKENDSCVYERRKTLQIYVFDAYERVNIKNALYALLDRYNKSIKDGEKPDVYRKAQQILFWMPDERLLVYSDLLPGYVRRNSVSVVSLALNKLYVIKPAVKVSSDLIDISKAFNFKLSNEEMFSNFVGIYNALNSEKIREIWNENENKAASLETIKAHVSERIALTKHVIKAVQEDKNIILSRNARDISFDIDSMCDKEGDLRITINNSCRENNSFNRMKFALEYESFLNKQDIDKKRTQNISASKESGDILKLTVYHSDIENDIADADVNNRGYVKEEVKFKIENYEDFKGNMWFSGLLYEDNPDDEYTEEKIKELLYGTDYFEAPQSGYFSENKYTTSYGDITYYIGAIGDRIEKDDNGDFIITLPIQADNLKNFESSDESPKKYIMTEIYMDMNYWKSKCGLEMAKDKGIINNVSGVFARNILSGKDEQDIYKNEKNIEKIDGLSFSSSQKEAFEHLLERKLTVLLGPPATGKTDFIARTIFTLAAIKKAKGEKLKVLVSAMSHTAIDNVLKKLDEKLKERKSEWKYLCDEDYKITKIGKFETKNTCVTPVGVSNYKKYVEDEEMALTVVGATGWAVYNIFKKDDVEQNQNPFEPKPFDLVIIDEASQIRVMDAFLQLTCFDQNTRILLAGDNDQLPPIIKGEYECDEICSVFDYFIKALEDDNAEDIVTLNENFRMNGILCKYSAKNIYDAKGKGKYRSFSNDIAAQILDIKNFGIKNTIDEILNPEYPLVFCKLSGDIKEQQELEVRLVNDIVIELMEKTGGLKNYEKNARREFKDKISENPNYLKEQLKSNKDFYIKNINKSDLDVQEKKDKDFWDKKCGIISPYHYQIKRVKNYIAKAIKTKFAISKPNIFIGTVDALQGQERDTVIVSYGFYDREKLQGQSEFIFSRNRFNVSLTRGKKKTIVFLSDTVAIPNITTNVLKTTNEDLKKGIDFIHGFSEFMSKEETNDCENCNVKRLEDTSFCDVTMRECDMLNRPVVDRKYPGLEIYCKRTFDERVSPLKFPELITDDPRKKAIINIDESYLVEAAAGSGKTTVLVGRMVSMIERGVLSREICAVTYTDVAAIKMNKRFMRILKIRSKDDHDLTGEERKEISIYEKYLGDSNDTTKFYCRRALEQNGWYIGTIDAFIFRLVFRNIKYFKVGDNCNCPRKIQIAVDYTDKNWDNINEDAFESIGCDEHDNKKKSIENCIDEFYEEKYKNYDEVFFKQILKTLALKPNIEFKLISDANLNKAKVYKDEFLNYRYDSEKEMIRLTFPELHYYTSDMLQRDSSIINDLSYRYFLIDEAQDISPLQMRVLSQVAGIGVGYGTIERLEEKNIEYNKKAGSIFIVGDPKQSIYHFRGADIKTYLSIKADFDKYFEVIYLNENFRVKTSKLSEYYNSDSFKNIIKECADYKFENMIFVNEEQTDEKSLTGVHVCDIYNLKNNIFPFEEKKRWPEEFEIPEEPDKKFYYDKNGNLQEVGEYDDLEYTVRLEPPKSKELTMILKKIISENSKSVLVLSPNKPKNKQVKAFYQDISKLCHEMEYNCMEEDDEHLVCDQANSTNVNMMTIHKSKGLEEDAVILFNPENMFSDVETHHVKYSVDEGTQTGYIFDEKYDGVKEHEEYKKEKTELLKENYRKIYVAATRARKVLLILEDRALSEKYKADNYCQIHDIKFE